MSRLRLIFAIVAVFSASAFQDGNVPIFRSITRLIQVSVIATDKNGKPVKDLAKKDFELFEDGQRQDLVVFVAEQPRTTPPPPATAPNEFSNQFTAANASRSGYTLILLDWLNSGPGARVESQRAVLQLLKQVQMNDLVSLCALDRGLRVIHDFTSDRQALVNKIATAYTKIQNIPADGRAEAWDNDGLSLVPTEPLPRGPRTMEQFLATRRVLDTFAALEQIAGYLGSVQGRKSLLWMTSGFPSSLGFDNRLGATASGAIDRRTFTPEMDRMVRRLNNADIAVYPVAGGVGLSSGIMAKVVTMKEIAQRTGGRAYYNSNDVAGAVRNAIDDSQISYTLGYYPTNSNNDGRYRNIRVRSLRAGVTLRFRAGYEAEGGSKTFLSPKEALRQALESPLDTTLLPISVHAERAGEQFGLQLRIDPSALLLRQVNGRRKGKVSVFFTFRPGELSGDLRVESESKDLDMPAEMYEKLLQQGLALRKRISVPAKATSLRILVRDEESALMGSITIPLNAVQ